MSSDAAQADTARAVASAELKDGVCLGIYEKALRSGPLAVSGSRVDAEAWRVFLDQVPRAGFSFLDLSIDESPEREARLDWDAGQCRTVRRAAEAAGTFIGGICLSLHRRIGPGSADPDVRRRAREVMARGLQVCHDLGVPVIQLAGYYCYYEDPNPDAERWYAQLLADAVPTAARLGVVMGIENVDGDDVTSLTKAMEFVDAVDSPYLQLYPDLGNIAEQGLDPGVELAAGEGHMVAMHAKDVRPGEPRGDGHRRRQLGPLLRAPGRPGLERPPHDRDVERRRPGLPEPLRRRPHLHRGPRRSSGPHRRGSLGAPPQDPDPIAS